MLMRHHGSHGKKTGFAQNLSFLKGNHIIQTVYVPFIYPGVCNNVRRRSAGVTRIPTESLANKDALLQMKGAN